MTKKRKILILGGGFGGVKTALELSRSSELELTLISDRDYFRYYPTLYHTATGGDLRSSVIPLSEIFKDSGVRLVLDEARGIEREKKVVVGKKKNYSYDDLIISLGVVTNFFNIKGLEEFAFGIKTEQEAARLRAHLHELLLDTGKPDLNYVIIGGGPTGVELAGALPGYLNHVIESHGIKKRSLHIDLVEAAPRLMPRMSRRYSQAIAKRLHQLGIRLYLGQTVQAETADKLMVSGHSIESHTVVWTAGVTNHPFFSKNSFSLNEHGKVVVDSYLRAAPDIFVIGDNADTPYSGMAQTALYDACFVANNLRRTVKGKSMRTYTPKRPVNITPAGPRWAAVSWGRVELFGIFGWLLRSAADFMGYKDYEPWWRAGKHVMAELEEKDDCPKCAAN